MMRSDEHIEAVLAVVEAAWKNGTTRHLRLGQLIDVIAFGCTQEVFTIPDDKLVEELKIYMGV